MLIVLIFAFIAGVLTILAPCVLPVVPLVLGAASTGGRRRTTGILAGFGIAFVVTTVLLASALAAAGATTDRLRLASAILLGLVGLSLSVDRIGAWAERRLTPVATLGTRLSGRGPGEGLAGGVVLGGAIGLVWAPCVGPIMAAVIATAVTHGPSVETVLIALAYVGGAAVPLGLVAGWGQRARRALAGPDRGGRLRRGLGVAMVAAALLVVTGLDLTVQTAIADALPAGWGSALAAVEQQPDVERQLDSLQGNQGNAGGADDATVDGAGSGAGSGGESGGGSLPAPIATNLPASVALDDLGPAPELAGITAWINSNPLTIQSLRGKVVVVEFWTFACINCIHIQPYVKAWYDRYASAGLVVIGVHTPELSFERDLSNVRDAVATADIRFPVAFDPAFATWNAYRNGAWPSLYFIDRSGRIRHSHGGEGDYAGSEQVIRELLAGSG